MARKAQKTTQQKTLDDWLEKGKGGYTTEQLDAAFNKVKNAEHWKNDIDAVVEAELEPILHFAIPWFTGGAGVVITKVRDGKIRVRAPGYWSNGMGG